MNNQDFRKEAHQLVDWIADYLENVEKYPVKSQVVPNEIFNSLPQEAPEKGEKFEVIFDDFKTKILKGITHWQHPSFHAYFSANSSYPSVLGEMLTATLGAQCMSWETSPAAAELEQQVMNWLKKAMQLPPNFEGVIQDTASTATLCALLSAREYLSNYQINKKGFSAEKYTVYCSTQTHSSMDKAVRVAGIGQNSLRKIAVDNDFAMKSADLEKTIQEDIANGYLPLCVVGTIGTTGTTAIDPISEIGEICQKYKIWYHIDGAFAGTAAILPEMKTTFEGLKYADSYVFNPHKWMFTNFDCTAYFVKSKEILIRTFEILPEYLKTKNDAQVNNYRDWGVQLGRRFRALKLWFVIRSFGLEGIREKVRNHLALAQYFAQELKKNGNYEILAPVSFSLVCFRFLPKNTTDENTINKANEVLMESINQTGKAYLTHTKLNGIYTIRAVFSNTNVAKKHVDNLLDLLSEKSSLL